MKMVITFLLLWEIFYTFTNNLFVTSEPPKYSNSNPPNLLLWLFCLIKSRAKPFLNPNLIFFSDAPQIVCRRIIKKNQNKDLENSHSNILKVPMSRTSYKLPSDKNFVKSSLCLSCKESSHGTDSITNNLEVTQMRCDASEHWVLWILWLYCTQARLASS